MSTKANKNRKHLGSTKSPTAKGRVSKSEEVKAAEVTIPCPPRTCRWRFADAITVRKLTEQVLLQRMLSQTNDQFDSQSLTESKVFRAGQAVRNEIKSRQWCPTWSMTPGGDTNDSVCPLARYAVDRAVLAAVKMIDWAMLARTLPPTVMTSGLRGTHAMLSVLKCAVEELRHSHGKQGTLGNSSNRGDVSVAVGDFALAGLDDDLIYANMALLNAEQSGRSLVDYAPISEVAEELRRHRVIDSTDLLVDDSIALRRGAELVVTGRSNDAVLAEWNRISQATKEAGMDLRPRDDAAETDLNGWEWDVAGFGFGVGDNKVEIRIGDGVYDLLESDLEMAACAPNPLFNALYAVEYWLKRHAPGLVVRDKENTIEELSHVVRRTGFGSLISEAELCARFDRAVQQWLVDRDYEHSTSFFRAVDEWSSRMSF